MAACGAAVTNIWFAPTMTTAGQNICCKIQASWLDGMGLQFFKDRWVSIQEKTAGQPELVAVGAKNMVGDLRVFDAVVNGVIQTMSFFTHYRAGRAPAWMFLSSYPMGLRKPHKGDVLLLQTWRAQNAT